jgi:alpha-aminoadipate carrier protein LysW
LYPARNKQVVQTNEQVAGSGKAAGSVLSASTNFAITMNYGIGHEQFRRGREMNNVACPECAGAVGFAADVMLNEITQCPECGVELEVVGLVPLRVELAPEVEEDWGE